MFHLLPPGDLGAWKAQVRSLIFHQITPDAVHWGRSEQLFSTPFVADGTATFRLPASFMQKLDLLFAHSSEERWRLLYRIVWRLLHENPDLMEVAIDPDIRTFTLFAKSVSRDIHKMHAFVRFKQVVESEEERFVAWYEPDHRILTLAAPFFKRRFSTMHWAIATPEGTAVCDRTVLRFLSNQDRPSFTDHQDGLEELWRIYYRAIFNPARVKSAAMKKEMPRRFWKHLPEAQDIPVLLRESSARVETMYRSQNVAPSVAKIGSTISELRTMFQGCAACPLACAATQGVFGEGPESARIVIVGEQPGDEEDQLGRPFVGPAGQVLNQALSEAGLDRRLLYLTNAVKHFKFTRKGAARLHARPSGEEINACRQWLRAELMAIRPTIIVALGQTAAQSLLGRRVTIKEERGRIGRLAEHRVIVTFHPSAILRTPNDALSRQLFSMLVDDLRAAHSCLGRDTTYGSGVESSN